MDENSPYEEDLTPVQAVLGEIKEPKDLSELKTLEELVESGQIGINWNEWLECVQWLSVRYTSGDNIPANWTDVEISAMYQDLQEYSYKDVQTAIIKLHSEGRTWAPNSSQIIGMLNKLGCNVVISQRKLKQFQSGQATECKAGGEHEWFELGWLHNEYGDPEFIESCGKRISIQTAACGAERAVPCPDYHLFAKPEPMWVEKFVETAQKIGLPDHKIDWILSNARPNLMTYAQYLKKYNPTSKEPVVEGEIV